MGLGFGITKTSSGGGGGGTTITTVANYSALPLASSVSGKFYWCEASQGTKWLPFSVGGTYYPLGMYYSNGVTWEYSETPYQATLAEVNTGTNTDKFVSPSTFTNADKWNTKYDVPTGNTTQYIRGDGTLATLPSSGGGGGSSVNYYLNGGTVSTVPTYYQMSTTAVIGTGVDFPIVGNGLISQWLTDIGSPYQLEIKSGSWDFQFYFNASSGGGSTGFYVELLKYDGSIFTSISNGSSSPESITNGVTIDLYTTSLAVPQTTLLATDRLALRVYIVNNSGGRTITMHTQDSHICKVVTNFDSGLTSLNGLTKSTQFLVTGTSGTDFNIVPLDDTNTFNLPTASATNRGALSSVDWATFNGKQNGISLTTTGSSGASTFIANVLNIPLYTLSGLGGVPTSRQLTINGTTFDLSSNRSWTVGDLLSSGSYSDPTWIVSLAYSKLTGVPTIPTVGTWGALNYPNWVSGTPFVKMTALGTFALDTNTYLTVAVTNVSELTIGTSGTDITSTVANPTTTPVITINIPTASVVNRGALSSTDWTTFNNKQDALTNLSGSIVFDFGNENDSVVNTILSASVTNNTLKSATFVNVGTTETSLDDFVLNGVSFNIENIVDNVSFDIRATAINNASGNYTINYKILI